MVQSRNAWIDFDGMFAARGERKSFGDGVEDIRDLRRFQIRWSAAAPVHLRYEPAVSDFGEIHLSNQVLNIW